MNATNALPKAIVLLAALAAPGAHAQGIAQGGRRASRPEKPAWEFAVTAYPTRVRGGGDTTSAIAAADRGPLHLEARYGYAWSELGFKPPEWLRLGAAGQRTRAYGGGREFQRGPFVRVSPGRATLGGFRFNPGSDDQVFVGSVGLTFRRGGCPAPGRGPIIPPRADLSFSLRARNKYG